MPTKPHDGALIYVDQQIEMLKKHVPQALAAFDATAVHQSRVATRRLKASLDTLATLVDAKSVKPLNKTGRQLRRRLGPLRDLDVMIDHLKETKSIPKLQPALDWIIAELESRRTKTRDKDARAGKPIEKLLPQFDCWWIARQQVVTHLDSIDTILTDALHNQFDLFAKTSDELGKEHHQIDVHELRIIGKSLRYTFEIAQAQGTKIPKSIFKTFKAMQESLGVWHDYVVLAETTLQRMAKTQIAHHKPEMGALLLELAKRFIIEAGKSLNHFKAQWQHSGEKIKTVLHEKVPLIRDVAHEVGWDQMASAIESQTDPDLPATVTTSPAASDSTDAPKVS